MPTDPDRRRAPPAGRRSCAATPTHLDATPLDEMLRWAGPDTWVEPARRRAASLELRRDRARLADAADDLRRHAHLARPRGRRRSTCGTAAVATAGPLT